MRKIIIAIDGHSSCGKSTLAKELAAELGYTYISSGKMYRAATLYFLENEIDYKDEEQVLLSLENMKIYFEKQDEEDITFLNGKNVEEEIVKMHVAKHVSPVSTNSSVRKALVLQQQEMGKEKGVVMDGRDIGTVVFKDAELKIFLTADPDVRAKRRFDELSAKGQEVKLEDIKDNILSRDYIDSTRSNSPLKQDANAVLIDNSNLTKAEQLAMIKALALKRIK